MQLKNLLKQTFLLLCFNVFTLAVFSQGVGINTTKAKADTSAMLDVLSTDKGILIPRILLQDEGDIITIPGPANSLLVFNTNEDKTIFKRGPGFYYNQGNPGKANWLKLSDENSPDNSWLLEGNGNIDPAINFIGTFTDQDVIFKRDDVTALTISKGGALLATGDVTTGVVPAKGAGTRLMWNPAKAAFRAGKVSAKQWDEDSVGIGSFAAGQDVKARGASAIAMGEGSEAKGSYNIAMGHNAKASNTATVAIGESTVASGSHAVALGNNSKATGDNSTATGNSTKASTSYATATGFSTTASGVFSFSGGHSSTASEEGAIAIGDGATASAESAVAMGEGTTAAGKSSFAIGNNSQALSANAVAMGTNTLAGGPASTASGTQSIAAGFAAVAMGDSAVANGTRSVAMGFKTIALASNATAFGTHTQAIGVNSTALGSFTVAAAINSIAMGEGTVASKAGSVAMGTFNEISLQSNNPNCDDVIFQIGMGTNKDNRLDAVSVTRKGDMTINGQVIPNKGVACPSDIRLKKDIEPLKNVLNNISNIQPIGYYFKDEEKYAAGHQIGFSAQEIEKEFPELVNKNSKGFLAVNYPQMAAVAIQAIKEQQEIIKKQEEKITNQEKINDVLNAKNADLEKRIEKLEKMMLNK